MKLFGGLAFFFFGIHTMTESMKQLSLDRIRKILRRAASRRLQSFLIGIGLTSLIQSSSTTSIITIGFLNVNLLTLTQAIPIIFGANIGTTITAQLIAFKLSKCALLFVIIGLSIYFFSKKMKLRNSGLALFGFGFLFFGLDMMSTSVKPLADHPQVLEMLVNFGKYPLAGLATGMIVTVLLQSSSTTIGILIALAISGLIDYRSVFYLILGENIGTCITAILASWGGNKTGKRLALGHTLFNIFGTTIALVLSPLYFHLIPLTSNDIARQIANTHTIFNIMTAMIFLPVVPLYARLLNTIIPGEDYVFKKSLPMDLDLIKTPFLALQRTAQEISSMIGICKEMLTKVIMSMDKFSYKHSKSITIDEQSVDDVQKMITRYLVEITKAKLTQKEATLVPNLLHSVNDVERIGDHCEHLMELAQKKHEEKLKFSHAAEEELKTLFDLTLEFLDLTIRSIKEDDKEAAQKTLDLEREVDSRIMKNQNNHVSRLANGTCGWEQGLVYNEILIHIEKICDHLCNITKGILHIGKR
jgi:phosphate:Na+ symporter